MGQMTDFFEDVESVKEKVRQDIRADILGTIRKVHYTHGVAIDLATALACEAVVECHFQSGDHDSDQLAQMLRWMADEVDLRSTMAENENEDGIIYE
jgi:hypothetical protein